jgi:hypothetical protein
VRHIWPRGSSTKTNEDRRSRVAVYLADVFSRRVARSTHTNNRVINELWNRVQKKRGPPQAILQQSLACSDLVVKEIFLKTKRPSLLHTGTRRTTEELFRRLHNILLVYFVLRFQAKYPTLRENLHAALVDVVDERILAHDTSDKCLIRSVSQAEQTGNNGLSNTAIGLIWRQVTTAIGAGSPENLEQVAWFEAIASRLYSSAEERIEAKLRVGNRLLW